MTPDVSVVVGAFDAMPYLTRCLRSVVDQTIELGRLELVAVDDGSTDGTGAELERWAGAYPENIRLLRQPGSGGPSAPRNRGLELARGRYVFFLDADDYLADDALERLVAMADRVGSDVVTGRIEGVGGRRVPSRATRRTVERADLFERGTLTSMSAQKLFRRALLDPGPGDARSPIRFAEDIRHGEDSLFTMEAYLRAGTISILGGPPCYYRVLREDGRNISRRHGFEERFASPARMLALIAGAVEPGERRDILMVRPFTKVTAQLCRNYRRGDAAVRRRLVGLARPLVQAYASDGLVERLSALDRGILEGVARDDHVALAALLDESSPRASSAYSRV